MKKSNCKIELISLKPLKTRYYSYFGEFTTLLHEELDKEIIEYISKNNTKVGDEIPIKYSNRVN